MSIQLINSGDTFGSGFNKANNNFKEQIVNSTLDGNTLKLVMQNGNTINVDLPIKTSGGELLNPNGYIELGNTSGFFNKVTVSNVDYLFDSVSYTISSPTILYLSNGDSTLDRIDAIYIDTVDNTIKKLNGTPNSTPTLPSLDTETTLLIGAVYVKALASSTVANYKLIYTAFISQNVQMQIDNGTPVNKLKDLIDVSISSPTNGQTIIYNSTTNKFENLEITANNGLHKTDQTFKLGGTLNEDINIDKFSQVEINGDIYLFVFNEDENLQSNLTLTKNEARMYNVKDSNTNIMSMNGTNFYLSKNGVKVLDIQQNLIKDTNNKKSIDYLNRYLINNNNKNIINFNGSNSISILKNGTINCNLNVNNLTINRTHTFQDKNGTLAHLEDIFSYPTGIINTDVVSLSSSAASGSLLRGYKYRFTDYSENAMIDMTDGGVLVRDSMYIEMTAKNNFEFEEYSVLNYYNIADWNYATIKFDESLGTTGTITSLQVGSEELLNNNVSYTGIVPFYNLTEYLANEINNSAVTNNTFWRAKSAYNSLLIYNSDNNQFIDTVSISGITPVQIRDFYGDATTHASNMKLKIKYDLNLDYITEIHDEGNLNIVKGSGLLYLNYFNSNFTNK